jgi:hypothetical protein
MAQYDLLLTQNVHVSDIEFSEKYVNISKGGLLSAQTGGNPTVLPAGTNGYQLVRDDAETTGLKWVPISAGHTQGTDLGTTSSVFELDTDGYKIELTAESASKLGVKVDGGATYGDLQAKDATFAKVTVSAAPSVSTDLTNKAYVDGILAGNDAMLFKGTIGSGGTYEITAFNSLSTYNVGWTYVVITAGTIKGNVCEPGDRLMAIISRAGTGNVNSDWVVSQANIDGAVTGPASSTDNYLALFNGTSGKIIKVGTGAPGTMAYANTTDYVAKALFDANTILAATTDNTPAALTVGASTFVGRAAAGNIAALTAAQARTILNVADGATANVGTVTSVSAGNGLNFSTINGTGAVILGTPSSLNGSSTNSVSGTTHSHAISLNASDVGALPNWVTAPITKTSTGTAGQVAKDDNFFYICTTTNIWKRSAIATNW